MKTPNPQIYSENSCFGHLLTIFQKTWCFVLEISVQTGFAGPKKLYFHSTVPPPCAGSCWIERCWWLNSPPGGRFPSAKEIPWQRASRILNQPWVRSQAAAHEPSPSWARTSPPPAAGTGRPAAGPPPSAAQGSPAAAAGPKQAQKAGRGAAEEGRPGPRRRARRLRRGGPGARKPGHNHTSL